MDRRDGRCGWLACLFVALLTSFVVGCGSDEAPAPEPEDATAATPASEDEGSLVTEGFEEGEPEALEEDSSEDDEDDEDDGDG